MKNSPLSTSSLLAIIFGCLALALCVGTVARVYAQSAPAPYPAGTIYTLNQLQASPGKGVVQTFATPSLSTSAGIVTLSGNPEFDWSTSDSTSCPIQLADGTWATTQRAYVAAATVSISNANIAAQTAVSH